MEFGQTSSRGAERESIPSPFWIQRESEGKWGTLTTGPDVGSKRAAVVLRVVPCDTRNLLTNKASKARLNQQLLTTIASPKELKSANTEVAREALKLTSKWNQF
jgi:hypothetical protein